MTDLPIVCSLDAASLRTRRVGLLAQLVQRATAHAPIDDGYRLQLAPAEDVLAAVARTVEAERHCCRFLRFRITVEPDGGPIVLELTGPPGSREFLTVLLAP